jgi:hypothetical protein
MRKTTLDPDELSDLAHEFQNPLETVNDAEVETSEEAARMLDQLAAHLNPKCAWTRRLGALTRALELIKGGISYYPGGDYRSLRPLISAALTDLRAQLVKGAALLICAQVAALTQDFLPAFEPFFPLLTKNLISLNVQTANYSHLTLLQIIKRCHHRPVALAYLEKSKAKHPALRQLAVEACHIICETWNAKLTDSMAPEIKDALSIVQFDPYVEIREVAEEVLQLPPRNPNSKKIPPSSLAFRGTLSKQNRPSPIEPPDEVTGSTVPVHASPRVVPPGSPLSTMESDSGLAPPGPEPDRIRIEQVMPPLSQRETITFKTLLGNMIATEEAFQVLDPSLILRSIARGAEFIPGEDQWVEELGAIFSRFADRVTPCVIPTMKAFGFAEWIIAFIAGYYSIQAIAESFDKNQETQLRNAFEFFSRALQMDSITIELTPRVIDILERLIRRRKSSKRVA